jgi:hypothetical protein
VENLAVILAVVGLGGVAVWLLTRGPAPTGSPIGAADPGLGTIAKVAYTAITNPNAINHAVFGVGTDTFKTFGDSSDFQKLSSNMCACYHGNTAGCDAALEQAPLKTCKPGDCDCHPTNPTSGVIFYRDSHGGPYSANFGPKVPIGGCRGQTPGAISNRAAGYCAGLV